MSASSFDRAPSSIRRGRRAIVRRFAEFRRHRQGATAVMFAVAMIPTMLGLGAALDYLRASDVHTHLQAAVDAAALAAAESASLSASQHQTQSTQYVIAELATITGQYKNLSIAESEGSGSYTVKATATAPTVFMLAAGFGSVPVAATAVAKAATNNPCIMALSTTMSPGLLANSSVTINAPTCDIDVGSTGNPAATFNAGDSFSVHKICVAGTNILNNDGTIPPLNTGCKVPSDPYAAGLPSVSVGSCTVSNVNYSGTSNLSPGVYCGNFNFNGSGTLKLSSGLYIFKGAHWNLNSGWSVSGTGVTFYFADSSSYIQVNSGVAINVTAPTSGTYANILMFEPAGLSTSSFTVNGSAGHTLSGLIHLPSRNITFNSMSNVTADSLTIVVNSIIFDTLNWQIKNSAFAGSGGGKVRLTQ